MAGDLEDILSELDDFYPGSKQKRSDPLPKPEIVEDSWEDRPQYFLVKGVETEFFPIGALAQALNKKPVTIRRWIREEVIPDAKFRSPKREGTRGNAGVRLWTRAQIEGIVRIAKEEGVFLDAHKSRSPRFKQKVWKFIQEGK